MNKINYGLPGQDNEALEKLLAEIKASNEKGIEAPKESGMDLTQMAKMAAMASGGGGGAEGAVASEMGADAMAGAAADKSLDFGGAESMGNSEAVASLEKPEFKLGEGDIPGMGAKDPMELGMEKSKLIPEESSLMDSVDRLKDPTSSSSTPDREAMLADIKANLIKRTSGYNQDELDAARKTAMESAGPSGFERAMLGLATFAGNKDAVGQYNKMNAEGKAEVNKRFDSQEERYGRDFNQLRAMEQDEFSRSNRKEDVDYRNTQAETSKSQWDKGYQLQLEKDERDAAMHTLNMGEKNLSLQTNKQLYGDAQAARDPSSRQSAMARDMVKNFMGKEVPESASALDLAPFVKSLPAAMLEKAKLVAKPSDGEKARDVAFGKDVAEYSTTGKANIDNSVKSLEDVIKRLEDGKLETGTLAGWKKMAGDKTGINTDVASAERQVQAAMADQLKKKFGGNPTDADRDVFFKSIFNASADPKENAKSLRSELNKLKQQKMDMESRGQHFEKNRGSLKGFEDNSTPARGSSGSYDDMSDEELEKLYNQRVK